MMRQFLTLVMLLLIAAGCKRTPEDIEKWRAEGNTRKLIAALDDTRQFMRIDAIEGLAEIGTTEIVEPLADLFDDYDLFITHKAIEVLAAMDDPAIEKPMLDLLDFKTDEARLAAIRALGNISSQPAADPLIAALNDQNEEIVAAAAKSLGQIGNAGAVGPLSPKVSHRSYDIRISSVVSLGQLGGTDAAAALVPAMGDLSENVRQAAVDSLTSIGPAAEPLAVEALRSGSHFSRESGMAVLERLNAVPASGPDAVWHRLAVLTVGEHPAVNRENAAALAREENLDILLEAAAHPQPEVRDYAVLALEALGEPVVSNILSAAEERASPDARAWLSSRTGWCGAPAWELDLWAAAAALNPDFRVNVRIARELSPLSHSAEQMMKADNFAARREYIPLLVAQFTTNGIEFSAGVEERSLFGVDFVVASTEYEAGESEGNVIRLRMKRCRDLAMKRLIEADYRAELPLRAALDDEDLAAAGYAARTLAGMDPDRSDALLAESINARLDRGEELSGTPLHHAMLDLELPAVEALALKIRPDETEAIKTAERNYPDVRFMNLPLGVRVDPALQAAPFKLNYFVRNEEKELRIIFRPDENGDWVPDPPLPSELPQ
jgi:HEAT repeat protein